MPVVFNAVGDEHALQFTLLTNPAVLSNGQLTPGPDAAGATIVLDRSAEVSGRLGVTLTLPGTTLFSAGLKNILTARYAVSGAAAPASVTDIGFTETPVAMHAVSSAGGTLPVVFDAGSVALSAVQAAISAAPAGGSTNFTVRGLRGQVYQLLKSADLSTWTVVDTATIGPTGIVTFTRPTGSAGRAYYKSAPAP